MSAPNDPFSLLLDIAGRSVEHARGLPAQIEVVPEWSGVSFTLAGHRLLAPMGQITEILTPPAATRLPGVQAWVRGVANVRGRLLPLFDMEAFLGGALSGARKSHRVMALEMGELYSGLMVSEVRGIESFPVDTFTGELPDDIADELLPYLEGSYRQDGELRPVFSPEKLVQDNRFFNVAA